MTRPHLAGSGIEPLAEIAGELRRLRHLSLETKEDVIRWLADARVLIDRLDGEFARVDLPEEVWHYLHDADVRAKDPALRQAQDAAIDALIAAFERGVIPESDSVNISIHPVWLVVIPVLIALGILYWFAR